MLSFDIQVEIIKKLPVKSLFQFRSVCKTWKSLIDSSHFISGYNASHHHHHLLIRYETGYREDDNEVKYVCFVDNDDDDDSFPQKRCALIVPHFIQGTYNQGTTILSSSHGLLCFTCNYQESNDSSRYQTRMAVLWNPAIRKSIAVAVPHNKDPVLDCCGCPHPAHKPFNSVIGFGVCPDTKDPKFVKITYIIDDYLKMKSIISIPCQVMVFTLSSGKWTTSSCNNLPPRKSIIFTGFQTNIGQFIYWLAYDRIAENGEYRNMIMSFDMSTHEFREVDLPDSLVELRDKDLFVSRLRDSLAVVEYNDVSYGTDLWKGVCVVWIMEDGDSKGFTKLFTIDPPNASVSSILGFRKNGEPIVDIQILEDGKYFCQTQRALVVYDPYSKHFKDLGISGPKHSIYGSSYTESLLLLDHDDGHILWCEETTLGTG